MYLFYRHSLVSKQSTFVLFFLEMGRITTDLSQLDYVSVDWILKSLYFRTDSEFVKAGTDATNQRRVSLFNMFGIIDFKEKYKSKTLLIGSIGHDVFKG